MAQQRTKASEKVAQYQEKLDQGSVVLHHANSIKQKD